MCLILDTNRYGLFLDPNNEDMKPVRNWVDGKNGKIAYSPVGKMKTELEKAPNVRRQFEQYRRAGKLKSIPVEIVEEKKSRLPPLRSDDPDIIALAQVSEVKLLVSGDKDLYTDFKRIVGGKIYQTRAHRRLLRNDLCP